MPTAPKNPRVAPTPPTFSMSGMLFGLYEAETCIRRSHAVERGRAGRRSGEASDHGHTIGKPQTAIAGLLSGIEPSHRSRPQDSYGRSIRWVRSRSSPCGLSDLVFQGTGDGPGASTHAFLDPRRLSAPTFAVLQRARPGGSRTLPARSPLPLRPRVPHRQPPAAVRPVDAILDRDLWRHGCSPPASSARLVSAATA